jgi:hypothetical protein
MTSEHAEHFPKRCDAQKNNSMIRGIALTLRQCQTEVVLVPAGAVGISDRRARRAQVDRFQESRSQPRLQFIPEVLFRCFGIVLLIPSRSHPLNPLPSPQKETAPPPFPVPASTAPPRPSPAHPRLPVPRGPGDPSKALPVATPETTPSPGLDPKPKHRHSCISPTVNHQ